MFWTIESETNKQICNKLIKLKKKITDGVLLTIIKRDGAIPADQRKKILDKLQKYNESLKIILDPMDIYALELEESKKIEVMITFSS